MKAQAINAIEVLSTWGDIFERGIITSCTDYDDYKSLPRVVEYQGVLYGKTGWNSDTCQAYYKTGCAAIAK